MITFSCLSVNFKFVFLNHWKLRISFQTDITNTLLQTVQFIYEVCCLFKLRSSEIKCGFVKSNLCGYSFIHNKATHSPSLTIHSVQVVMIFLLINQFIIIYLLFMLDELEWTKIITTNWLFQAHDNQHHKVNTMDGHTICAVLYCNMTLLQYDLSKLNGKYWTAVSHLPDKWMGGTWEWHHSWITALQKRGCKYKQLFALNTDSYSVLLINLTVHGKNI